MRLKRRVQSVCDADLLWMICFSSSCPSPAIEMVAIVAFVGRRGDVIVGTVLSGESPLPAAEVDLKWWTFSGRGTG
jgi:hypothetical protein